MEKMKVAQKILKVMEEVSSIEKVKSGGVNYAFQAWADVLPAIRTACIKHGLVIVPSMGQSSIGEWQGANSKSATHNVPMKFLIIDADSGECIEAEWSGEARDVSDKGKQKAATSGMKYWLLKLFMVPDRESAEHDEQTGTDEIRPQAHSNGKPTPKQWLSQHGITKKTPAFAKMIEKGHEWENGVQMFLTACEATGSVASPEAFANFVDKVLVVKDGS